MKTYIKPAEILKYRNISQEQIRKIITDYCKSIEGFSLDLAIVAILGTIYAIVGNINGKDDKDLIIDSIQDNLKKFKENPKLMQDRDLQ